ncbi:hypothetical protein CYMTET_53513 [Cymbomonas tetramitiformis]|uniref:Uncharacterized protein n=1 Tax=Cymbomonas tetramitiformis TaxID=36881 RepID=A0AAE0BGV7_9CHLO|nr:hypothetical protein CYMTET_53513 [Cymbomonas tetramitiformis]
MPLSASILTASGKYFMDDERDGRSADADLLEIIMDLRKQVNEVTAQHVKALSDRVNGEGFTPRAEKPTAFDPSRYRRGGKRVNGAGVGRAHAFATEERRGSRLLRRTVPAGNRQRRQRALDRARYVFWRAVTPEIINDFSACSFDVSEDIDDDMAKYMQYCRPVDTSMGGFHVGGAAQGFALNTFTHATAAATVAPRASDGCAR